MEAAVKDGGLVIGEDTKVLDIGCNTGGHLEGRNMLVGGLRVKKNQGLIAFLLRSRPTNIVGVSRR